jgi:hypothetical protein
MDDKSKSAEIHAIKKIGKLLASVPRREWNLRLLTLAIISVNARERSSSCSCASIKARIHANS